MRRILIPAAILLLLGVAMIVRPGKDRVAERHDRTPAGEAAQPEPRKPRPPLARPQNPELGRESATAAADIPRSLAEATTVDWEDPERLAKHLATLIRWAASDPAACRAWLGTQPAALQQKIIPEIAGSLMAEAPLEAFHFLNELPPSTMVDEMLRQAAMELATGDPAAALAWADQQTDDAPRELLLAAAYLVQAQTTPEAAAKAVLEQIHDPARRDRTLVEIAQRWVQQDPAAAAGFAATLVGDSGPAAASAVASQWVLTDATACGAWLLALPPVAARAAFRPFLDYQLRHDRDRLTAMEPTLQDPEMRQMLQQALAQSP